MSGGAEYELRCYYGHRTYRVVRGGVDPKALRCDHRLTEADRIEFFRRGWEFTRVGDECGVPYRQAFRLEPQ